MGFISRKMIPCCGTMQPVERYKKLLADVFSQSRDGLPNDGKISKLCEYAAKNPIRIPEIAKSLEERCYKELRNGQTKFIHVIVKIYNKLLCICKGQMGYFAISLLDVVNKLIDKPKQDDLPTPGCQTLTKFMYSQPEHSSSGCNEDELPILGCQMLTKFIYSQVDRTYADDIKNFALRICEMARRNGEERSTSCLRASSLHCLAAMVWFMSEYSCIFSALDEIVHSTLDNYELDPCTENDIERGKPPHYKWANEAVKSEGRSGDPRSKAIVRARPQVKDPSLLTREEIEQPRVWAEICLVRIADLARDSSAMQRVLRPMFVYFDTQHHWRGLAMAVLSAMSNFLEKSGNQESMLWAVIRHLDSTKVERDSQLKLYVVRVAAVLAGQIESVTVLGKSVFANELHRHLRRSLKVLDEPIIEERELDLNVSLQTSIEDCLLEIAKGPLSLELGLVI